MLLEGEDEDEDIDDLQNFGENKKSRAAVHRLHCVMGFTSFMLVLGLMYSLTKIILAITAGQAYKNKDQAILTVSFTIWLYFIYMVYKALEKARMQEFLKILDYFKYLLIFFVLIMSFVMTGKSWYDTVQSCSFAAQFCLIWMLEIFLMQSHKLADHGIKLKK